MAKLSHEEIVDKLKEQFGEDLVSATEEYGMLIITFSRGRIHDALKFLKEEKEFGFHFMTDLCGVHFPDNKGEELGVVYQLHNFYSNQRIRIKVFFPAEDPITPTVSDIWDAANWMERETYDFYGIIFDGHPDLRRILNVDDMDYFPMLKQYPLEDATREDKNDAMFGR